MKNIIEKTEPILCSKFFKFINPLKVQLEPPRVRSEVVSLRHILILSKHLDIFPSRHPFKISCFKFFYIVPASRRSQIHLGCGQLHSLSFLVVTPFYWLIGYRRFGIKLHTSPWMEIFFNISTLEYETTRLSRKVQFRFPSDTNT